MKPRCTLLSVFAALLLCGIESDACTSAIVSAAASANGRAMLWKHRDTSCESNFVENVGATDSSYGYVALFNAGDSLLKEAWIGANDTGFAIMNTASYNLAPDTATYKDREGFVMTEALKHCRTVDDFEHLLCTLTKPLGVQANFGVIDAEGNGAYFETDDYSFVKYDLKDAPDGVIIRTNYSFSGNDTDGYGYIRYENASHLLADKISAHNLIPADFTEGVSRSFYHSLNGIDHAATSVRWITDQDFVPRYSSTASVVIETGGNEGVVMWAAVGYPPCAIVEKATISHVPDCLRPTCEGYKSPAAEKAIAKKRKVFPIKKGNGKHYIDMNYLRPVSEECHKKSMENYAR